MQVIVYEIEGKQVVMALNLDCGLTINEIAEKDVPSGVEYTIMDSEDVSIEATTDQKLSALDTEYESQFTALAQAYSTAIMAGDTTTAASIQTDYTDLKAQYQTALEAINSGE
ncbi:MAG: hypothetical protein H6Q69_2831 [Firmicutes bacterium]|nr:hypothetical protein [Bacillota bacterium]MBP2659799.1 hypothetical protein [Bacillota bacterium]